MTPYKATFKCRVTDRYDKRYSDLFYEYRGHEYIVQVANSWTACSSDYLPGGSMSLYNQHKREQKLIDDMVDNPVSPEEEAKAIEEGQKKNREFMKELDSWMNQLMEGV